MDLEISGFAIADERLSHDQCDHIISSVPGVSGGRGGVRGLESHPTVRQLLRHKQLANCLWKATGRELVAVRAILFDKTAGSNWSVQWHQDRVIAIRERMNVAGYGPWSMKAGVPHVEPPASVLAQMVVLRIYLDPCNSQNGPLRVIPESHRWGKLGDEDIAPRVEASTAREIHMPKGGILLFRPLLVHASTTSSTLDHRRVLHIDFAPAEAISPLQWQTAIPLHHAA